MLKLLIFPPNWPCPQCLTDIFSGPGYFLSFNKSLLAHTKAVLENTVERKDPNKADWVTMSLAQSADIGIAAVAPKLANV